MNEISEEKINLVISNFGFAGTFSRCSRISAGHINDTFDVLFMDCDKTNRYILQKVNTYVYKKPTEVMINMDRITTHIARKIVDRGGNPEREVLNLIHSKDDKPYFIDPDGGFWRVMRFVDGEAYMGTPSPEVLKQGAIAFGRFQSDLVDFPVNQLYETIIDFHNTPARYVALENAIKNDRCGRLVGCGELVKLAEENSYLCHVYDKAIKSGAMPLRATHNDTKLNNVMLDRTTGKPICVLDLDTCMPGYSVNDFGDAIRSETSTGGKLEQDRSKIHIDMNLYKAYCEGFIGETIHALSIEEIDLLGISCQVMTYELGIRYLTDYLDGDPYFKGVGDRSLLRARNQLYFLLDMKERQKEMEDIVHDVVNDLKAKK